MWKVIIIEMRPGCEGLGLPELQNPGQPEEAQQMCVLCNSLPRESSNYVIPDCRQGKDGGLLGVTSTQGL